MARRIYIALRMVVAVVLWLQYAVVLARVGILAMPTERSYSWQELRHWALNPGALSEEEQLNLKLNLKYTVAIMVLMFSGALLRLLSLSLLVVAAWGMASWAISMLLVIHYVREKGTEGIAAEYGFALRGVLALHSFLYLPSYAFIVFMTGVLTNVL